MPPEFFTIVCDYQGGTYIAQVVAGDHQLALLEWAALLRREAPIADVSAQLALAVTATETDIVPLTGLTGVWCWTEVVADALALINIIHSARPASR
jgi:hypothetical protein